MSYLADFKNHLESRDLAGFTQLWEEYCTSDQVDTEEFKGILREIKGSELAKMFAPYMETALPLWRTVEDEEESYDVLRLICDIQSSNSGELADLLYDVLKKRYGDHRYFNEKIRLVGLRNKDNFQGAITNFELLNHMDKGKFVFHDGGWGVGEIVDISLVREELVIEFDYVQGRKYMSFENAFNVLSALPSDHFLSLRFGTPDALEALAKKEPLTIIRQLLKDLGPKTAAEIKDELCELVIPEGEWTKWWQNARNKAKKDTQIEAPATVKEPFLLRNQALSHDERFLKVMKKKQSVSSLIQTIYSFLRDFSEITKNEEAKELLRQKLLETLSTPDLPLEQSIQVRLLINDHFPEDLQVPVEQFIQELSKEQIFSLVEEVPIAAFKKRILATSREQRDDWREIFSNLFMTLEQNSLRDYLVKELLGSDAKEDFIAELKRLRENPTTFPHAFAWYFQKALNEEELPLSTQEDLQAFFESFLILMSAIGENAELRDLTKKMVQLLSAKRFALVRRMLKDCSIEYAKEFILLVSKCRVLTAHDIKILHSLAEVVHPELKTSSEETTSEDNTVWTTQEGYDRTRAKLEHLGSVETVQNAKEIEAARALGDLRENSEYKFALEKRSRLQAEMKMLSQQLNKARVITEEDISTQEVGIGGCILLKSDSGETIEYTILGPWDTDPDRNIVSVQSKIAQEMMGKQTGDQVVIQGTNYTIESIASFLQKVK